MKYSNEVNTILAQGMRNSTLRYSRFNDNTPFAATLAMKLGDITLVVGTLCHANDNFCKKIARSILINRAKGAINAKTAGKLIEYPLIKWVEEDNLEWFIECEDRKPIMFSIPVEI